MAFISTKIQKEQYHRNKTGYNRLSDFVQEQNTRTEFVQIVSTVSLNFEKRLTALRNTLL